MKSIGYYLKSTTLSLLLFTESYFLLTLIIDFVKAQNFLSFNLGYSIETILVMLLTIYTFALSIGGWGKWEQYLIAGFPVCIAIFISLFKFNANYAILAAASSFLILVYDMRKTTLLKSLLIKFDPKMVLRFSTKGLLFIFSIVGGAIVFIYPADFRNQINVGRQIAEITEEPVKKAVQSKLEEQTGQYDPATMAVMEEELRKIGIYDKSSAKALDLNMKDLIEKQVNNSVEPYKNLIPFVIALYTFGLLQLYATVAYVLYISTIDVIFWFAKYLKFFKVNKIPVEQEQLTF